MIAVAVAFRRKCSHDSYIIKKNFLKILKGENYEGIINCVRNCN